MDHFILFLLTLLIALIGGTIGFKLKLPVGAMVGAMIAVVLFNLLSERAVFYSDLRVALQIFGGAMIGSRIGKKDIAALKSIVFPTLLLLGSMVILNLGFGILMFTLSDLDVPTSLFASAPGGVSDMAIISADLGANPAYVAILQLVRILTIFTIMPPLFKKIITVMRKKQSAKAKAGTPAEPQRLAAAAVASADRLSHSDKSASEAASDLCFEEDIECNNPFSEDTTTINHSEDNSPSTVEGTQNTVQASARFGLLMVLGAAGGILLWLLGVTAGAMIGSMLATAAFGILRGEVPFPKKLRFAMQICSGAFIGIQLNREGLAQMGDLVVPLLIMIVGILFFVFLVAFLMHKLTGLDLATCMLASTPGGVQEMALLSEDLGADTPKIAIMQTTRLISVILFFPTMLKFITALFTS